MNVSKVTEENVEEYLQQLTTRTNGQYITQGVSFNKNCPRQMELLKMALLESVSFSGLVKELLALQFKPSIQDNKKISPFGISSNENKKHSAQAWI